MTCTHRQCHSATHQSLSCRVALLIGCSPSLATATVTLSTSTNVLPRRLVRRLSAALHHNLCVLVRHHQLLSAKHCSFTTVRALLRATCSGHHIWPPCNVTQRTHKRAVPHTVNKTDSNYTLHVAQPVHSTYCK